MIAKTLTGLEGVLASELSALGAENVTPQNRAVAFEGNTELMYRINLWSRASLSILKPVFDFTFESQQHYYDVLREYPWDELFDVDKTIAINANAFNSEFTNSHFLAQRTKDAVADYFTEKTGKRPNVDLEDPQIKLNIYINGDQCSVSLDSSGAPLFKRGYRRKNVQAPMNEVLAAGLIMLSGWDKKKPFYDPMCGSATFSIEAAMMALNMAPSIFRRHFSFQHWKDYDAELWESLREQARKEELNSVPEIIASDINNSAMDAARTNLMEAGLLGRVKLEKKDFFLSKPAHDNGLAIINPPYGRRLHSDDIHNYYKDIGAALKHHYTGFEAWIISPDNALTHKIGLRHSSQTLVFNGQLECKFLGYDLYQGTKKTHKTEMDSTEREPYEGEEYTEGQSSENRNFEKQDDNPGEGQERKPFKKYEYKQEESGENKPFRRSESSSGEKSERRPYVRRESKTDSPGEKKPWAKREDSKPWEKKDDKKPWVKREDSKPWEKKDDKKPWERREDRNKDSKDNRGEKSSYKKAGDRPFKREEKKSDHPGEKRSFRKTDSRPDKSSDNKTDRPYKQRDFKKPGRKKDD
ncbi:MAG: hypothetical protein EA361_15285 [Bacteroidetes bacterium]|nr:MAG: hypothetical protein EA361_15285 [Bacteroidota bacterium]